MSNIDFEKKEAAQRVKYNMIVFIVFAVSYLYLRVLDEYVSIVFLSTVLRFIACIMMVESCELFFIIFMKKEINKKYIIKSSIVCFFIVLILFIVMAII